MADEIKIGIIGGSGLYNMEELEKVETIAMRTPFGATSDKIVLGLIKNIPVAFIPRHGNGHVLTPTEVPYAANIFALKTLGVRYVIGVSACGSLREDYQPGHICVPDQLIDFTREPRRRTFFGEGLVAHVGVADPFSPEINQILVESAKAAEATVHNGGTFVTVEGPRFSTRAESHMFRQMKCSIIGMTTATEAFLAREAEMAYGVLAHITDYDVWHAEEADVSVEAVVKTLKENVRITQQSVVEAVPRLDAVKEEWPAHSALKSAIITHRKAIPQTTLDILGPLVDKYLKD